MIYFNSRLANGTAPPMAESSIIKVPGSGVVTPVAVPSRRTASKLLSLSVMVMESVFRPWTNQLEPEALKSCKVPYPPEPWVSMVWPFNCSTPPSSIAHAPVMLAALGSAA